MLAQSLVEYGLLESVARGATRLGNWIDVWVDDWGYSALVAGGIIVGGWVIMRVLSR